MVQKQYSYLTEGLNDSSFKPLRLLLVMCFIAVVCSVLYANELFDLVDFGEVVVAVECGE